MLAWPATEILRTRRRGGVGSRPRRGPAARGDGAPFDVAAERHAARRPPVAADGLAHLRGRHDRALAVAGHGGEGLAPRLLHGATVNAAGTAQEEIT
jgi:hypothetical protein